MCSCRYGGGRADLSGLSLSLHMPMGLHCLGWGHEGMSVNCIFVMCSCRYGGGRADLSDTMAGTLWVADALFAFAANGARAFHLHWGHGGLPFQGGSPNVGVQTNFDYNVSGGMLLVLR